MPIPNVAVVIATLFVNQALSYWSSPTAVNITSVDYLGVAQSNPRGIYRDLGYYGNIGGTGIQTYGDTFKCDNEEQALTSGCTPLSANSAGLTTNNPLQVNDFGMNADGDPDIFCGYFSWELEEHPENDYGMGVTNVVETGQDKGIIFFVKNYRPAGETHLVGSGVAAVDTSGSHPTCRRTAEYWWSADDEPQFGDHGAISTDDGFIYALGGFQSAPKIDGASQPSDVYVARVRKTQATTLSAYEYWNGEKFTSERLHPNQSNREARVMTTPMGSMVHNPYLNKYLYFTTAKLGPFTVQVMSSDTPFGPWSSAINVYDARINPANSAMKGPYAYAPVAQPQYDSSGKSIIVSYTYSPNIQQVIRVNFCDGCKKPCETYSPTGCMPQLISQPGKARQKRNEGEEEHDQGAAGGMY